ncbi:MAG: hypothetical protein PVH87_05210 [Desulfobacteraceae bacterium]
MAKIIIVDENNLTGALLRKALEREDHQVGLVTNWQSLSASMEDLTIDLVLIHQEDSEWTTFNQFKQTHQDIPAMLYVMPDYGWTSTGWVVKAVQEALSQMNKLDAPTTLWTWGTGFDDTNTNYYAS